MARFFRKKTKETLKVVCLELFFDLLYLYQPPWTLPKNWAFSRELFVYTWTVAAYSDRHEWKKLSFDISLREIKEVQDLTINSAYWQVSFYIFELIHLSIQAQSDTNLHMIVFQCYTCPKQSVMVSNVWLWACSF